MQDPPTTPVAEVDPRITRATEVLRGMPETPYSPGVSAAERSFWLERSAASLRDLLDLISEQAGPEQAS
jgi:hypothetical protein